MTSVLELPNILIVDDDADDVYVVKHRLNKAGVRNPILVFCDGDRLLTFLGQTNGDAPPRPCLLLLDLKMPLVDGFDVLAALRAQPRFRTLPIAVITSSPNPSDRERAATAGANEYHEKFPTVEELSGMVARAAAMARDEG